ncbi:DUF3592 domain-containing protein [Actinokineospora enzanensis]|uniref:DUF3592 domain-containing protein n=1 Tax=Actinokineospora enzanensis TaxID=155975 RepID=UPI00036059EC|nr:DUF3592 domain-containing protein [Actinokineospora enzanensis]
MTRSDVVPPDVIRGMRRRSALMVVAGLLLFGLFTAGVVISGGRFESLLVRGEPAAGVVVASHPGSRWGSASVEVRFTVAGVERVREVRTEDATRKVGDPITVHYDPDDPEQVTGPDMPHDPGWLTLFMLGALGLALLLTTCGMVGVVRWVRRTRALRAHEWRSGQAELVAKRRARVRFDDGDDDLVLAVNLTSPVAGALHDGPVLVGGSGTRLVVARPSPLLLLAAKQVDEST